MIYLKAYKIFESQDLTSDIRDCFLSVSDMTHVKVTKTLLHNIEVSIGLSHRISPDESGISKWDVRYKELSSNNKLMVM